MNRKRLARIIEKMQAEGLTQILVTSTPSVYYLTGYWVDPDERLWVLGIRDNGECALFGNTLYSLDKTDLDIPLYEHTDTQDPVKDLAAWVRGGRIGIDKFWPSKFLISLMEKRGDIVPVPGSAPIDLCRMCKDEEEMHLMRISSQKNDACTEKLIASLAAGQTEKEVAKRYSDLADSVDGTSGFSIAAFGANAADPHHSGGADTLREGMGVVLDVGLDYRHMQSDMTRTVFFGEPTVFQKEIYEIVREANRAGIEAVRPGVPMKTFDDAARKVITDAGYGEYFIHRTGHGIGMSVHEPPDVSSVNEMPAMPGMVFSIEPGIYIPGKIGVRVEDLVCVTENGHEVLNALTKDLVILG